MSRRRKDVTDSRSRAFDRGFDFHPYRDVRSRLARSFNKFFSVSDNLGTPVRRRVVKSLRAPRRLRTITVTRDYLKFTPHTHVRQVVSCVKDKLRDYESRQGSGAGRARRRFSRSESRRQLFQAARKSC